MKSIMLWLAAAKLDAGKLGIDEVPADDSIAGVLDVVYLWAGMIAVLVIVIAGFIFVLSRGDAQQVTRARNAIIAAAAGLVIVLAAFVITHYVIGNIG